MTGDFDDMAADRGQRTVPSAAALPVRPDVAPPPPPVASGRLPGGPVGTGKRTLYDPRGYEVTFDDDVTDEEIEAFKRAWVEKWAGRTLSPTHYRFGRDEPWKPIARAEYRGDRWGIWPLVAALVAAAAVVGAAVEVWQ